MSATAVKRGGPSIDRASSSELRPIPSFLNYYASADGAIYSTVRKWMTGPRRLFTYPDKDGYLRVRVTVNGKIRNLMVHQLVTLAFHGPRPSPSHQVRHLDGSRTNNCPVNLCWGTGQENSDDRERHGRTPRGTRSVRALFTATQVREIRQRIANGELQKDVAFDLGVHRHTVGNLCNGVAYTDV